MVAERCRPVPWGEVMHIIYVGRRGGALRSVNLDLRWLLALLALLVPALLAAGMALGNLLAPKISESDQALLQVLDEQREELGLVRSDAERQLQAFSAHIAALQARLTRLDALGERLTELADLDASEFDFSLDVGQGGPELPLQGEAFSPPPFMEALDELSWRMGSREAQLEVLEQVLAERRLEEAGELAGRPVARGYVSSSFGRRIDPLTGRASVHRGVDFAAQPGSEVLAVAAGVVTWSGRKTGYGLTVEISHADGYVTLYAHNQSNLVKVGDLVQRGQPIATVGRSGRSTGYHVHFEVSRHGKTVNPAAYIARVAEAR